MDDKNKKNLEVVSGNGEDLDISTVFEHTKTTTSQNDNEDTEKKEIVIPKGSSDKKDV